MAVIDEKIRRVRGLLEEHNLAAAAFSTQANFAWLTGGADNHVGLATELGGSTAVVTRDRAFVVCDNIEEPRMREEELWDLGLDVISYPWWEGGLQERITALVGTDEWGSDVPLPDRICIEPLMYPLRAALTEEEVEKYRTLGKIAGIVVQEVADRLEVGQTEHEVAGMLSLLLMSQGVIPQTILVAADDRIIRFRHPVPTDKRIEKMCLISCGARWKGLICSLTRIVHFGKSSAELIARHQAACTVDAALMAHTVPGVTVGDAFRAGLKAYEEQGYPEEWKLHHQGGPTGYKAREFRVTANREEVIAPFQAFAWNPTVTGAKSEDTILAVEPHPEVLTITPDWPLRKVQGPAGPVFRPGILVK